MIVVPAEIGGGSVRRIRPRLCKKVRTHSQAKFKGCPWRRRRIASAAPVNLAGSQAARPFDRRCSLSPIIPFRSAAGRISKGPNLTPGCFDITQPPPYLSSSSATSLFGRRPTKGLFYDGGSLPPIEFGGVEEHTQPTPTCLTRSDMSHIRERNQTVAP
jgi:hypothetical protein